MAARRATTADDQTDTEQNDQADETQAVDAQGNPLTEEQAEERKTGPLVGYVDADFVDPATGKPAPVSATTDNLQGTVSNTNGRVLVKVAVRGYIGEEPVVVLGEHAGEFSELIDALATAAKDQRKAFAKNSDD